MNPEQILAHLKRLTSALSPRQLVTLAAAFIGVVGVMVGSAYWINTPSYSLLFSDMDAESAASVVTKLKAEKVPYVLDEGGRTIRVASERLDDLRLEFSSQGLPSAGRIGFEIFDRTAFGTTEFLEHINYRRALEGELARTISTISDVASARVHISMAKESLFVTDTQPAKASVVLKLRDRRPLSPATVAGITGLVAASVESLRPESVVILDTFGRSLTQQVGKEDDASGLQLDAQRRLEKDLSTKVVALLEPIVGAGRARVNVTARLNGNSEEETEERWDPTTVVRSKQTSMDGSGGFVAGTGAGAGAPVAQGGIAGARANAPPNSSTAPAVQSGSTSVPVPQMTTRSAETTNYEVSKLTRHRIVPRGQLARLSVAVVLDDERTTAKGEDGTPQTTSKPRTPADLQRIQHLVASSVGLDADRGDEVTVENIAFGDEGVEAPAPEPTFLQRVQPLVSSGGAVFEIGRIVAIAGLAIFAFLMVLRPMARSAMKMPIAVTSGAALAAGQARTVADLESQIESELDAASSKIPKRLPALTKRLSKTADQQPEHVARLVRSLIADEDR